MRFRPDPLTAGCELDSHGSYFAPFPIDCQALPVAGGAHGHYTCSIATIRSTTVVRSTPLVLVSVVRERCSRVTMLRGSMLSIHFFWTKLIIFWTVVRRRRRSPNQSFRVAWLAHPGYTGAFSSSGHSRRQDRDFRFEFRELGGGPRGAHRATRQSPPFFLRF
jgi:hypothetical protein